MRTIFVGDVHGCAGELEDLLDKLQFGGSDRLLLVGDLVAKGPDSKGVLALVRRLRATSVLGNHEERLLRARAGEAPMKPVHRAVAETLGDDDWRLLESLPTYVEVEELGVVVVHGGLVPGVPLDRQERRHVVSMRSLLPDGSPSPKATEGVPWGSRWPGPQRVVFGHDAIRGIQRHPHAIGLDSGCVYGRSLTALVMPGGELVSVPARRKWAEPGNLD